MRFDLGLGAASALALCACSADKAAAPAESTSTPRTTDVATADNRQAPAEPATKRPDAGNSEQADASTSTTAATIDAGKAPMQQSKTAGQGAAGTTAAKSDASASTGSGGAGSDAGASAVKGCKPAAKPTDMGVHFHHVGMLSMDPEADMQFYEKYFSAPATEYCRSEDGTKKTLATKTERGWFLYDRTTQPPDDRLNSYIEHVGWLHPDPVAELQRLVEGGAPLYPEKRGQCASAAMGTAPCNNYWFYLRAPNGAEIEDALGPGPATMGFGHVHFVMGVDFDWFSKATDGAIKDRLIDQVNHTDVAVEEMNLANETVVDSRGKSIDHLGYSVADLDAHRARVMAAGLEIAEDISFKPEFGFRSFFLRNEKGIWIELVEDAAFTP
jgi:predicted enzyme related to lactoylglutathione lyase